ncbi:hypothetical protein AAG570_004040 [Ranatra chinensis]|uniref:FHA domain-containing protein n=1 Tax=Ranatra chinensis TaxID=642074 RepID=A0ABD0YR67_9HEMI
MQRPFSVFGRMDGCHVTMAHPSVSRYHAVLQFRMESDDTEDRGFYIYDLGSTHGTFVNKYRVKHKVYTRVRVGHILKIGCSSRLFILKGPPEDEEVESELTVTELKERRRLQEEERKVKKEQAEMEAKLEEEKKQKLIEERGIDWGMSEDADEETDLSENPYAVTTNEELYIDDPKKTLRGWFEREGEELTYDVQKADKGMFVCKIVLPLDSETGRDIVVEISGKSKKEAIVKCALEACRHIDRLGLLRQSHHESRKRQVKNWEENDYYDSDEDNFLDRTGQIEKKREKRMKKLGKIQESVETYQSLLEKHREVVDRLQKAEDKLYLLKTAAKEELIDADTEVDALDAFMKNLSQNKKRDKLEIKLCRQNIEELKKEEAKLIHFVNLAKPANLPDLKPFVLKKPAVKVDCSLPSVIKASDQENVTAIMQETIEPPEIEDCETKSLEKNVKYIGIFFFIYSYPLISWRESNFVSLEISLNFFLYKQININQSNISHSVH